MTFVTVKYIVKPTAVCPKYDQKYALYFRGCQFSISN